MRDDISSARIPYSPRWWLKGLRALVLCQGQLHAVRKAELNSVVDGEPGKIESCLAAKSFVKTSGNAVINSCPFWILTTLF